MVHITFNRTIVELKRHICWEDGAIVRLFNRTIVELKLAPILACEVVDMQRSSRF